MQGSKTDDSKYEEQAFVNERLELIVCCNFSIQIKQGHTSRQGHFGKGDVGIYRISELGQVKVGPSKD